MPAGACGAERGRGEAGERDGARTCATEKWGAAEAVETAHKATKAKAREKPEEQHQRKPGGEEEKVALELRARGFNALACAQMGFHTHASRLRFSAKACTLRR